MINLDNIITRNSNFNRMQGLFKKEQLKKIYNTSVTVVGCGGVGGYALESLARMGIPKIVIFDFDIVMTSDINRQITALNSTIGQYKTNVIKKRILDINPNCEVITYDERIVAYNIDRIFFHKSDYILDLIDDINAKESIIENCILRGQKFISCMAVGNRTDASKIKISNLKNTKNDPFSKKIRFNLNKKDIKLSNVPVVFSEELPFYKANGGYICSISYVPAVAGLLCTNYILKEIMKRQ